MEALEIIGGTLFGMALGVGAAFLLWRRSVRKWMEREW